MEATQAPPVPLVLLVLQALKVKLVPQVPQARLDKRELSVPQVLQALKVPLETMVELALPVLQDPRVRLVPQVLPGLKAQMELQAHRETLVRLALLVQMEHQARSALAAATVPRPSQGQPDHYPALTLDCKALLLREAQLASKVFSKLLF